MAADKPSIAIVPAAASKSPASSFFAHDGSTMREGSTGVYCESEDLPCSYGKLLALSQSGSPIPPELKMTPSELGVLVSQLDALSKHLERYKNNIGQACQEGYVSGSPQVANMGVHLSKAAYVSDGVLDPVKPEILLFATPTEGAEQRTQAEIGSCIDGKWTGDPHQTIVGAAFLLPGKDSGKAPPDGFAGPLDNWHVHLNVCLTALSAETMGKEDCEQQGGTFVPETQWMVHAYVVPEFDDPIGVFNFWNPSVWPKTTGQALAAKSAPHPDMSGHDMSHTGDTQPAGSKQ